MHTSPSFLTLFVQRLEIATADSMNDLVSIYSIFRICKLSIGDGSRLNLNGDSVSSYVELEGIDPLLSPFCFFDIFYSFYICFVCFKWLKIYSGTKAPDVGPSLTGLTFK